MNLELEVEAGIRRHMEGWQRTLLSMAEGARCTCQVEGGKDAQDEMMHDNPVDCPVVIYLRMARLAVEDLDR